MGRGGKMDDNVEGVGQYIVLNREKKNRKKNSEVIMSEFDG
jgi:hypothetical protein